MAKINLRTTTLIFSGLGHLAEGRYKFPILGNIFFHASLATLATITWREIIINGFKSFIKNRPDMDSLVALGVTSAI